MIGCFNRSRLVTLDDLPEDITCIEESKVIEHLLNLFSAKSNKNQIVTCKDVGLSRRACILKDNNFYLLLVNPEIIKKSCLTISPELFNNKVFNFYRYEEIVLVNGINKKEQVIRGKYAFLVQKAIDKMQSREESNLVTLALLDKKGRVSYGR